jgi:hypothetical protein
LIEIDANGEGTNMMAIESRMGSEQQVYLGVALEKR